MIDAHYNGLPFTPLPGHYVSAVHFDHTQLTQNGQHYADQYTLTVTVQPVPTQPQQQSGEQ